MSGPDFDAGTDPAAAIDALVGRAIDALSSGPDAADVEGRSDDEHVTATLGSGGTLRDLVLDPRVLRGSVDDLARGIVQAVNRALDERPGYDPAARAEELRAVKEASAEQTRVMRTALETRLGAIVARAEEAR